MRECPICGRMIEVASIADHADECAARLEGRSAASDDVAPRPAPSLAPPAASAQVKRRPQLALARAPSGASALSSAKQRALF